MHKRPARSSNKNGIVERQNGSFKTILELIEKHDTTSEPTSIVGRASFLCNLFHGSKLLSAFQLAKGYVPSILGMPRQQVPSELFDTHVQMTAARAIQRALHGRIPNTVKRSSLTLGTKIWIFHKGSRHTDPVEWLKGTVVEANEHMVRCKREDRSGGPPMYIAYEDITIRPSGELAEELMQQSLDIDVDVPAILPPHATPPHQELTVQTEQHRTSQAEVHSPAEIQCEAGPPGAKYSDDVSNTESQGNNLRDQNYIDETLLTSDNQPPASTQTKANCQEAKRPFPHGPQNNGKEIDTTQSEDLETHPDEEIIVDNDNTRRSKRSRRPTWKSALLSSSRTKLTEKPNLDIGSTLIGKIKITELRSDKQRILTEIQSDIQHSQVSLSRLEGAPIWVSKSALEKEYRDNWEPNVQPVPECDVPRSNNIMSSHVGYKLKTHEDGSLDLKARICPHGNRDQEKDTVRSDSTNAQFDVIRLLLFMAVILHFRIGVLDIKGAYMKSGDIQRLLYVRPPRDLILMYRELRNVLWKLLRMPYGISEAGRQWARVIEHWLFDYYGFERVIGLGQFYIKYNKSGKI